MIVINSGMLHLLTADPAAILLLLKHRLIPLYGETVLVQM